MKPILSSIFFLLFILTAHAQKPSKLDSLKNVLAHLPVEGKSFAGDTLRVRVLCEMGERTDNIDDAVKYFEEAMRLCEESKKYRNYCETSIKYVKKINKNQSFYKIGEILFSSLGKAEFINDRHLMAEINYLLGTNFYNLSNYEMSRKHLLKAKKLFEILKDYDGLVKTVIFVGNTLLEENKNEEGIINYKTAYSIANGNKLFKRIPSILSNIGLAFEQQNKLDSALNYIDNALFQIRKVNPLDHDLLTGTLIEKSYILYLKKDYKTSIAIGEYAMRVCPAQNLDFISYAHRVLYRSNYADGNYKIALENLVKYSSLRDSLENFQKQRQLNSLKAIYENEKSQNEVIYKNTIIKYLILTSAIILFSMLFFWYSKNRISKQKDEILFIKSELENLNVTLENRVAERTQELVNANEELIRKNREIEEALFKGQSIERLRISSELHDNLGGTLSSINWRLQALNKENLNPKDAEIYDSILSMTKNAYSDVRTLSHNLLPKTLQEDGLKIAVQKLVKELNDNKQISFDYYSNLVERIQDKQLELNMYAITLELINNIIKHSKAKNADIVIKETKDCYYLKIEDDGVGLKTDGDSKGFGVKNLENRIESIKGKLQIESSDTGTFIKIVIPKNQQMPVSEVL